MKIWLRFNKMTDEVKPVEATPDVAPVPPKEEPKPKIPVTALLSAAVGTLAAIGGAQLTSTPDPTPPPAVEAPAPAPAVPAPQDTATAIEQPEATETPRLSAQTLCDKYCKELPPIGNNPPYSGGLWTIACHCVTDWPGDLP